MTAQTDTGSPARSESNGGKHRSLVELLALEPITQDRYRAPYTFDEPEPLYGGQVAAQALHAAGLSVESGYLPHSLHGYFLRPGDSSLPVLFEVHHDRDGRSFQARRVDARQQGEVIFTMAASFCQFAQSPEASTSAPTSINIPAEEWTVRLASTDVRVPEQPYPSGLWPTRAWLRITENLPANQLLHACALTYLSDITTGNLPDPDSGALPGPSIDHALWFHRSADLNDWTLIDCHPKSTSPGRGLYTGSMFDHHGSLVASIVQEALLRPPLDPACS